MSDVHCNLCKPDGSNVEIAIDAAPHLSEDGRVDRIVCALHETDGRGDIGAQPTELSSRLYSMRCDEDRRRARDSITTAYELDQGVGQPLTAAWLELDACRSALGGTDHPAILGRLELVASLLSEAVYNLLSAKARCQFAAADGAAVECAREEVRRSENDNGCLNGPGFPVRERGHKHRRIKEHHSTPRARAPAH